MRTFDYNSQIDGKPMLMPDEGVEISRSDLDSEDSGRDESGVLHRQMVREKVTTWGYSYAILTREEYRYMQSLFKGKAAFVFTYLDDDGQVQKTNAYCAKNSITLHNAKTGIYKKLKFNIIEC